MSSKRLEKALSVCVHAVLFFMLLELAASQSFGGLEISLVALAVVYAAVTVRECGGNVKQILLSVVEPYSAAKWLMLALAAYILADMITVFYSSIPLTAMQKYKAEGMMLFFCLPLGRYAAARSENTALLRTIAWTGLLCSMLALANLIIPIFPQVYFLRLSLRTDYNMFAAVLFTALVTGVFLLLCRDFPHWKTAALWCGWLGGCIFLTASRRTWLILPWCGAFLLGLFLIFRGGEALAVRWKRLVLLTVSSCLIGTAAVFSLQVYMQAAARSHAESQGETTAAQRYESLREAGESKRLLIWQTAWEEYQTYTPLEKCFGRGAGYDILLYDQTQSPLILQAYPDREKVRGKLSAHNFLLADLLCGGIVKAVLGLTVWLMLGLHLLCLLRACPREGWLYVIQLGFAFMNCCISNRFGFLYDRLFWIFAALLCFELYRKTRREGGLFA